MSLFEPSAEEDQVRSVRWPITPAAPAAIPIRFVITPIRPPMSHPRLQRITQAWHFGYSFSSISKICRLSNWWHLSPLPEEIFSFFSIPQPTTHPVAWVLEKFRNLSDTHGGMGNSIQCRAARRFKDEKFWTKIDQHGA